jgi:hypothetical protein
MIFQEKGGASGHCHNAQPMPRLTIQCGSCSLITNKGWPAHCNPLSYDLLLGLRNHVILRTRNGAVVVALTYANNALDWLCGPIPVKNAGGSDGLLLGTGHSLLLLLLEGFCTAIVHPPSRPGARRVACYRLDMLKWMSSFNVRRRKADAQAANFLCFLITSSSLQP